MGGSRPARDAPLQRNPIFSVKRQRDLRPLSACLPRGRPVARAGLGEGQLHKSVTQGIPTLYLLSDKEAVMGDELGAAGGGIRLTLGE